MLEQIGAGPWLADLPAAADGEPGRVARVDRGLVVVLTEHGPVRASLGGDLLGRIAANPTEAPCTGDWCLLRRWPDDRTTVERILPRRTALLRAAAGAQAVAQVLCANVDVAAVVVALHPEPALVKVERLLALARHSGAVPVVVLTKADLVGDAALVAEDVRAVAGEAEVVVTSTATGEGLARLRELPGDRGTLALVGPSGQGKSSLTNALVGAELLATRAIRPDGRGRHTSVRRELVPLPGGGAVIDTPGLRGVGLVEPGPGLDETFPDIAALAAHCRFADCAHAAEPDCAVRRALDDGSLAVRRFDHWEKLTREARGNAARGRARVRAVTRNRTRAPRRLPPE